VNTNDLVTDAPFANVARARRVPAPLALSGWTAIAMGGVRRLRKVER
jgi:hypothetical protein